MLQVRALLLDSFTQLDPGCHFARALSGWLTGNGLAMA